MNQPKKIIVFSGFQWRSFIKVPICLWNKCAKEGINVIYVPRTCAVCETWVSRKKKGIMAFSSQPCQLLPNVYRNDNKDRSMHCRHRAEGGPFLDGCDTALSSLLASLGHTSFIKVTGSWRRRRLGWGYIGVEVWLPPAVSSWADSSPWASAHSFINRGC